MRSTPNFAVQVALAAKELDRELAQRPRRRRGTAKIPRVEQLAKDIRRGRAKPLYLLMTMWLGDVATGHSPDRIGSIIARCYSIARAAATEAPECEVQTMTRAITEQSEATAAIAMHAVRRDESSRFTAIKEVTEAERALEALCVSLERKGFTLPQQRALRQA